MDSHMTIKEIQCLEAPWPVWVEDRKYNTIEPMIYIKTGWENVIDFFARPAKCKDDYNKTWRCWINKPTNEEMKNDEWEDEEYERG